jgi:predicted S18 family serine protease
LTIRTHWPWISALLAAFLALNPLGLDVIYAAFFSGEVLSRNIWGPIALIAIALMVLAALLEWRIRTLILNRRARGTKTA